MKQSLVAFFVGLFSGSFGTIYAAKIKQKSDLYLQMKEHEHQKNLRLLDNLENLVGEIYKDPASANLLHPKLEEVFSLLQQRKQDWFPEDSYDYASASLWLRNNGKILIEDAVEYVKTKDASFREYTHKDESCLTNFRKGISGYMNGLLKKLENHGRSGIKQDFSPNHGKESNISPRHYKLGFEFIEKKVSKVPSKNILPDILLDKTLKFIVSHIPLVSEKVRYQPLGERESVLIRAFLRELIEILEVKKGDF